MEMQMNKSAQKWYRKYRRFLALWGHFKQQGKDDIAALVYSKIIESDNMTVYLVRNAK